MFYETLPDGRAILPFSALKMLGSVQNVDIISSAREVKELIRAQKESGQFDKPDIPEKEETVTQPGTEPETETLPETGTESGNETEVSETGTEDVTGTEAGMEKKDEDETGKEADNE